MPGLTQGQNFQAKRGTLAFKSDAPLEIIQASSGKLRGALNPGNRTFAFAVNMASFEGFNSALQRQHFNENYLESHKYPDATFLGKIIEEVDFSQNGTYTVRAKGTLKIHNIEQERIIRSTMTVTGKVIDIKAEFDVPLADHQITIPKIVSQKIAEVIHVTMTITLQR
ncbi:MAG: YceI family protein [Bacteroidia bacterium]|nr:YceI family protein [Bacteroidia bacterium]